MAFGKPRFGLTMFPTDYAIQPVALAQAAEERGFESLFFPEHTHIPASRATPFPAGTDLPRQYWHTHDPFVAIKFIRYGISNQAMRNRFHVERQTLANLQHPYITRLIDGGSTDDGLPYLIMEYVDGKPIDQHCDERRLNVGERIKK